jgi:CheY-like chemotaxis protein
MPVRGRDHLVEILLVEDSSDDANLMLQMLKRCDLRSRVTVVEDGEEAIHYLNRRSPFDEAVRPDLIVLDLNLPRKSGHEVLAEIKEDERLRRIPVIILTSSDDERALEKAYDLYANCCICKPGDLVAFARTVGQIEQFWLHVASTLRDV